MTLPYLPYSQQNYADWKARRPQSAIAGLLSHAKQQAGIPDEEDAPPMLAPTPPFNPQDSQQVPDAHAHKKGLLGRIGHALGGDRIQPEVAALLTPDQQSRVRRGAGGALWDYLARGETTGEAQQRRAGEMLTLGDTKQARDAAARNARVEQQIQAVAGSMPPQEGAEYAARMRLTYGLPNAAPMAQAADQMRAKDPMQVSRGAAVRRPDGTWEIPSPITPEPEPPKPVFAERPHLGGTALFKDGVFDKWVVPPKDESSRVQAEVEKRENAARVLGDDVVGVDTALAEVASNPSAFGLKNALPTIVRQRLPGRDQEADATTLGSLEYVVGRLRHDRFGGALSALEASKAARIFSEPTSPPEVVAAQLRVIKSRLESQQASIARQNAGQRPQPTGRVFRLPDGTLFDPSKTP